MYTYRYYYDIPIHHLDNIHECGLPNIHNEGKAIYKICILLHVNNPFHILYFVGLSFAL